VGFGELTNTIASVFDGLEYGSSHEKAVSFIKTLQDIGLVIAARQESKEAEQRGNVGVDGGLSQQTEPAIAPTCDTCVVGSCPAVVVEGSIQCKGLYTPAQQQASR
jgi:pentose-5-phosphate-3-epimerase